MGAARRGMKTVIERIDPRTLADLIIKATALQEMANAALRDKNSPYRIAQISISATIPPGVTFTIQRLADEAGLTGYERASSELVAEGPAPGAILSLGGEAEAALDLEDEPEGQPPARQTGPA